MGDDKKELISQKDLLEEWHAFKKFAIKKNIIEMAVGVIMASAFGKFANAVAEYLLMPIINAALYETGKDWRNKTIEIGAIEFEMGKFIGATIDFLITALILYIIYIKLLKPLLSFSEEEKKKEKE